MRVCAFKCASVPDVAFTVCVYLLSCVFTQCDLVCCSKQRMSTWRALIVVCSQLIASRRCILGRVSEGVSSATSDADALACAARSQDNPEDAWSVGVATLTIMVTPSSHCCAGHAVGIS